MVAISAVAGMALMGYLFYNDIKDTITVLSNTVYPGKRSELGGTGFVGNWFSEFYYTWVSEKQLPAKWLNICEFSHYMNFMPVVILGSVATFIYNRKVDFLLLSLSILSIILLAWILVGFPEFWAKLTLLELPVRPAGRDSNRHCQCAVHGTIYRLRW